VHEVEHIDLVQIVVAGVGDISRAPVRRGGDFVRIGADGQACEHPEARRIDDGKRMVGLRERQQIARAGCIGGLGKQAGKAQHGGNQAAAQPRAGKVGHALSPVG